MSKHRSISILYAGLTAALILGVFGIVTASFNEQINYQGKLTDDNDLAVSGATQCMRFSLYDAAENGSELWTEDWDGGTSYVSTTNGLFSVLLGSQATLDADFNQDTLYLGVQFDPGCDGTYEETFAPRKRLGTVPAAIEAKQLGGKTWAAPDAIGSGTPAAGDFTALSASGIFTTSNGSIVSSATGELTFSGTGGTYSEDLTIDFGSIENTVTFGTGTGVTDLKFGSFNLTTTGILTSGQVYTDTIRDETGTTILSFYSGGLWYAGDSYNGNGYNTTGWSSISGTTLTDGIASLNGGNLTTASTASSFGGLTDTSISNTQMVYSNNGRLVGSASITTNGTTITAGAFSSSGTGTFGKVNITDESNGYQIDGSMILTNRGSNNIMVGSNAGAAYSSFYDTVAVGSSAGYSNQSGYYNTFVGSNAGYSVTGNYNTVIGYNAMYNHSSGSDNTAVGYYAGGSGSSGNSNNSYFGSSAGYNNTGSSNTFIGYGSGYNWSSGSYNTLMGDSAGGSGSNSSSENTLVGYYSGYYNTGGNNTMMGTYAGQNWSSGGDNVLVGSYAGGGGYSSSSSNSFFGGYAGYNWTGSDDVVIGYSAGGSGSNSSGYNVVMGSYAGYYSTGGYQVAVGHGAGYGYSSGYSGTGGIHIGYNAGYYMYSGDYNVDIGYEAGKSHYSGTNDAGYNIAIGYQADYYRYTGDYNIAIGQYAQYGSSSGNTGSGNISLGYQSLYGNGSQISGSNNVAIGYQAGYSTNMYSGSIFIGYQAGQNETTAEKLYIDNSNTSSPLIYGDFSSNAITINGTLEATFSTANTAGLCYVGGGAGVITDCDGGPADYAEYYPVEQDVEAGDVVSLSGNTVEDVYGNQISRLEKSQIAHDSKIIGIVSTMPGHFIGDTSIPDPNEKIEPISLSGRAPVKVSLENGPIEIGDWLTSSSTAGVAMKSTKAGATIGKALESYNSNETGKIMVFISVGWYGGSLNEDGSMDDGMPINSSFIGKVKTILSSLGLAIEDGVAFIKDLTVEKLKVGSKEKPTGITLYDEVDGRPYCLKVKNGEITNVPGECGNSSPEPPLEECDAEHLNLCNTQELCEGVNLYWYVGECHLESEQICEEGITQQCGSDTGACQFGIQTCINNNWGECVGAIGPVSEICDDDIDNDCDGSIDTDDEDCQTIEPEFYCGDGNLDEGEECDDGNVENGDGCSSVCQREASCDLEHLNLCATEIDCTGANGYWYSDLCNIEPEFYCGDGNLDEGEECDDGNIVDGDGCSATCQEEIGGCTDPIALNYNSFATIGDDSCTYTTSTTP